MCGIIGIYNHPEASKLAYLGLFAQLHRGQESAGIVSNSGDGFLQHHEMGMVADIFDQSVLARLKGNQAIGHVRYSTHGGSSIKNCQPLSVTYSRGSVAVAHNGNIVNGGELRKKFEEEGSIFQTSTDTEIIVHQLAKEKPANFVDRLKNTLPRLLGSFSLVFLTKTRMIAARDPWGFRPLAIGKKDETYVVASETCAFDLIGATYIRDVKPGEIVIFNEKGMESIFFSPEQPKKHCVFEYVYFARPDSLIYGNEVYDIRKRYGQMLAREAGIEADVVVPVPDSGLPAAIGYAQESGIPFEMGLIRNHYVGRTFIEPEQSIRSFGVRVKLNPSHKTLKGKRVILIDDSLVRGTTSQKIIKMVREAGAKEVHLRISSPPTSWPCFYGIDTPSKRELISSSKSIEEIRDYIQADSLAYLSHESLFSFDPERGPKEFCSACFTGEYAVDRESILNHIARDELTV